MKAFPFHRAGSWLMAAALCGCAVPMLPETRTVPPAAPEPSVPAAPRPAVEQVKLAGSSWYWLGTITPAGVITPTDPGGYNVEFLDGGQLAAQMDCNRGTASWKQSARRLQIGPVAGTRAACAPGSESARFARQLQTVRGAGVVGGVLELETPEGTMTLARDPDWRLRSFECGAVAPVVVVFGREQALVRWDGNLWALKQQPTGAGVRYGAGNVLLFTKGPEATLVVEGQQVAGPCVAKRLAAS
jgi:heat shock protein HslJ